MMSNLTYIFFFFQAEDGIRDYKVTGVQTCALPIYSISLNEVISYRNHTATCFALGFSRNKTDRQQVVAGAKVHASRYCRVEPPWRSEERRVGKECRSRWSPYH